MQNYTSYEPFDPVNNIATRGARWKTWINRFENFLIACDITNDERKLATLLYCVGEETYKIYTLIPEPSNPHPETPLTKYESAKLKLNNKFITSTNSELERLKFRQAKLEIEESIEEFHNRLANLSTNCNFGNSEEEIKSQIIQGTTSTRLRRYALKENPTLEQLIKEVKANEATDIQLKRIESSDKENKQNKD